MKVMKSEELRIAGRTILLSAFLISALSCSERQMDEVPGRVRFRFAPAADTRSGIAPDENSVENVNIAVYRFGVLHSAMFFDGESVPEMTLDAGEYSVYAVGNIGEKTVFPNYEIFMPRWRYRISSTSELGEKGMAFTASDTLKIGKGGGDFTLKMTRMAARCGFRFDASALEGMKVKSVRLRQAALDMAPFGASGSVPENIEDIGDYASEADIAALEKGETAYFYCLENDRGRLLPDNTDIWGKVPDKIPDMADKCTYIEVAATVSGNPDGYTGDVIYRFYIGEDTTTDFSVKRNTAYAITLTASGDGLGKKGWLIDTSGLGIDPLFNFNPPELPEYVGQWARIRFPNADGLRTVTVSSGNEEIIVGTASEGIDSLCLENGAILLYAPEVSRKDIYLYLSDRTPYKTNPVSHISLQSAERSASLQIPCGVWPEMLIADRESGAALKSATVNEDGLGVCRANVLLKGMDGNILAPASFAMPDEGIAGALGFRIDGNADIMGRFEKDFILGMDTGSCMETSFGTSIVPGQTAGIQMKRPGTFSGGAAAEAVIYGKAEGSETIAAGKTASDGAMCLLSKLYCTVNKAFPGTRYLGAIHNTQLDICSAGREGHTELHTIDVYGGAAGSENATWNIFRTDPALGTSPSSEVYGNILKGHDNLRINSFSNGKMELALLPPEPDTASDSENPFFASGAFCLVATVMNPYSLKKRTAYYILDIILDISVTAQLDFLPGHLGFYYVPYNVHYASRDYAYSWKNNLPAVIRPVNLLSVSSIGPDDRISSSIAGDKAAGLVPVTADDYMDKGNLEYRTRYASNDYEDSNDFPFCESTGSLACSMLLGTFNDNEGNAVSTDIGRILSFKICPLNEDGSIKESLDKLVIDRSNHAGYPAFEGFYNITRCYDSYQGTGSSLDKVGRYVIEASARAQSLSTPFFSDSL